MVKRAINIDHTSLCKYTYLYRFGQSSSRARKRTHCCVHSSVVGAADTHTCFTQSHTSHTCTHKYIWSSSREHEVDVFTYVCISHAIYTQHTLFSTAMMQHSSCNPMYIAPYEREKEPWSIHIDMQCGDCSSQRECVYLDSGFVVLKAVLFFLFFFPSLSLSPSFFQWLLLLLFIDWNWFLFFLRPIQFSIDNYT